MNYNIDNHDMNIIIDALKLLQDTIKNRKVFGLDNKWPYSLKEINSLFQSLDNKYVENI